MNFTWFSATNVGHVRESNEDSIYPRENGDTSAPLVVAVADGMGGHAAGETASRIAIEVSSLHDGSPEERIKAANQAVYQRAVSEPELTGMGTTLTLVALEDDIASVGHVGDSRLYRLRNEELELVTEDHTVIAEMVAAGRVPAGEEEHHPYRHLLTRAVGLEPEVEVDSATFDLQAGDRLLLCSDGLSGMVDNETIARIMREGDPSEVAAALIASALDAGGHDNVSAIVVDIAA